MHLSLEEFAKKFKQMARIGGGFKLVGFKLVRQPSQGLREAEFSEDVDVIFENGRLSEDVDIIVENGRLSEDVDVIVENGRPHWLNECLKTGKTEEEILSE